MVQSPINERVSIVDVLQDVPDIPYRQPSPQHMDVGCATHISPTPHDVLHPSEPAEEQEEVTRPYSPTFQRGLTAIDLPEQPAPVGVAWLVGGLVDVGIEVSAVVTSDAEISKLGRKTYRFLIEMEDRPYPHLIHECLHWLTWMHVELLVLPQRPRLSKFVKGCASASAERRTTGTKPRRLCRSHTA